VGAQCLFPLSFHSALTKVGRTFPYTDGCPMPLPLCILSQRSLKRRPRLALSRETELALGDFSSSVRAGRIPADAYVFHDLTGTPIPAAMPQLGELFTLAVPAGAAGRLLLSAGSWGNGRPFHAHGIYIDR